MDLDLDAIDRLASAATPGPWQAVGEYVSGPTYVIRCPGVRLRPAEQNEFDAEFIAASRTLLPALAAEVRRLRAEREAAEKAAYDRGWMDGYTYVPDLRGERAARRGEGE